MFFNSISFFVFLTIVFILYWKTTEFSENLSKWTLLVSSYIFYAWWDWRFLILILISSFTDFIIGQQIFKSDKHKQRVFLLICSVSVNIGILLFFKYFNFFIDSFNQIFGVLGANKQWNSINIILPVGISFYTFQTLSYTIDIFNRKISPTKSALTFFTFVAFFPQLVAGPIERAKRLIPQFEKKAIFNYSKASSGLKLIVWGLFKKMVIADQLSVFVDAIYSNPESYGRPEILLATFMFGYQIYCDFSGYSDIAIGTARLFGIDLMTNFQTPYFATTFRDFWHRWHISLSSWFRDYVYIPLGGNRGSRMSWIRNIMLTFIISGLWHGANFTFLLWGFIHGIMFVSEHFLSPLTGLPKNLKKIFGILFTFFFVNITWLFFRAESWVHIKTMIGIIMTDLPEKNIHFMQSILSVSDNKIPLTVLLFIFPIFIGIEIMINGKDITILFQRSPKFLRWGFYYVLILSVLIFGVLNAAPQFIYFQF